MENPGICRSIAGKLPLRSAHAHGGAGRRCPKNKSPSPTALLNSSTSGRLRGFLGCLPGARAGRTQRRDGIRTGGVSVPRRIPPKAAALKHIGSVTQRTGRAAFSKIRLRGPNRVDRRPSKKEQERTVDFLLTKCYDELSYSRNAKIEEDKKGGFHKI